MIGIESLFPICGTIDAEGRLVDADPPLAVLHVQTGGKPGGMVVIPQLVALVRLVAQLQAPVSRAVATADNGTDIELFINARPDDDMVQIEIVEWTTRPAGAAIRSKGKSRRVDFARAAADFSWTVNEQLVLTAISDAPALALGSSGKSLVGQSFTRFFSLFESEDGTMPLLDAFAAQRGFAGQQARLRGSDYGILNLAGIPLFNEGNAFAGYRGTAVRVGETDEKSPDKAPSPDSSFGAEIGRVLKAPLDRIIANADVIRQQNDGPLRRGYADYAADIASAGRHLMSLVDDLVEVQAIESPDFRPEREAIDLCDVARRAAGLLAVRAADSGVSIDAPDLNEALPANGEFRRVLQILVNLIGNAVRYSPQGGMIWLRAERDGGNAVLIVADQGKGIASADHDRVFEKFERLDRNDPSGSGLGLYISRRLARAMGGDLQVDSALGQGARFILTLPARD